MKKMREKSWASSVTYATLDWMLQFRQSSMCRWRKRGLTVGAARGQVLAMVMKNGLRLAVLGLAAGQVAALILNRALEGLLVGVSTTDPATLAVTALVLLIVAILACYVPAWRAARLDPMAALRFE